MLFTYFNYAESAFFILVRIMSAHELLNELTCLPLVTAEQQCVTMQSKVHRSIHRNTVIHNKYTQEHTAFTTTYGTGLVYGMTQ